MMDARYINALTGSIRATLTSVSERPIEIDPPRHIGAAGAAHDVSVIVTCAGTLTGSIVMGMSLDDARSIAGRFMDEEVAIDSPLLAEALGEIASMISSNAMCGCPIPGAYGSCPVVIVGAGHRRAANPDEPCVLIPVRVENRSLSVEVSIRGFNERLDAVRLAA